MSPVLANFLFEVANFLLLAAVLGWALFKPVRKALDKERAARDAEAAEGKRLREEAERLSKEAHALREGAEREAADQRAKLLAAAQKEADALLEDARQENARQRETLRQELATARATQTTALADEVARLAAESVRRLLDTLSGPALDDALVQAACERLETLPEAKRHGGVVESAHALGDGSKARLHDVLGDDFSEQVVGELGAGVRVTTPAGQVDASAQGIAQEAARALSREAGGSHG